MSHNICLIDDQIPLGNNTFIEDTKRMNSSNLKLLLSQEDTNWSEVKLKELLLKLLEDDASWNVSAFKHPNFYLSAVDEEYYLANFVIFDWDYGTKTESAEELLRQILAKSFSIVTIYTGSDKQEEIKKIVEQDLKEYRNRIEIIIKSDENSPEELISSARKLYDDNFSFRFSNKLRDYNRDSLENILVEFGKPNIKDIIWLFGDEDKEGHKISLNAKDISGIIVDKLRSELITKNFGEELPVLEQNYLPSCDEQIVKKMWSLRLYYKPQDSVVRKGDLIFKENEENIKYLVISSDCHLKTFWKKNFGYLTLLPIYKIKKNNEDLITKLKYASKDSVLKSIMATSLVNLNPSPGDGPIILPCVPSISDYEDYFLFPKEITSLRIPLPDSKRENPRIVPLDYSFVSNFTQTDRITISEPFITPLVEHILYNISGYGVQDFPQGLRTSINNNIKEMLQ